ncbi:hypothetical protein FHQ18_05505 [Deferribacter autotrophicus]|uniref:PsbP C-terminal domain-containing protein n=1 Tax=Deferribacter autotrophicus TaxID=500465 RepID=A0A5A8F3A1_9BACT|nr:hypothetical protein [Deferribacter autotrophicus]KAA0258615.1 hypothetical protein FHQ18_05505 [Deferribacter autotrophicus]
MGREIFFLTSLIIFIVQNIFAGTLTYKPNDGGYEITFPIGWVLVEKDKGATMIAYAPANDGDQFRERVVVNEEYVGNNTNVEFYLFNAIKGVKKKYPSFVKMKETNTIVDNIYAKEIEYAVDVEGVRVYSKLILLFTRGLVLKFFFLADENDVKEYKALFEEIKNRIRFK